MIFLINLQELKPNFNDFLELIGKARKERIQNELSDASKLCHLGSGLLYRYAFGNNYEEKLKFSEHGKPYMKNGPSFNVSHSHDYAVLYIGKQECGIDIEKAVPNRALVTPKIFNDEEILWINQQKHENFFYAWTRKESISKTIGLGLIYPFKNIPVLNEKTILNDMEIYTKTINFEDYFISASEVNIIPDMTIKKINANDFL